MKNLRKSAFSLLVILGLNSCAGGLLTSKAPVELEEAWATDNTLRTPESVVYDEDRNTIYVSNINGREAGRKDGDGFISRLSPSGEVEELHWVTGLNNPLGMALHNNVLYVADIDEIVAISTQSGAILGKYKADKAGTLNDVAVDEEGNVYVSDSREKRIYLLRNGRVSTWLENTRQNPNGLYVEGDRMIVALMSSGDVRFLDPDTKEFTDWTEGIESADGIAPAGGGNYLISNWQGEIYYVNSEGKKWRILDTKRQNINAADIAYSEQLGLLLVPTFRDNRVVAYRVNPS